METRNDLKLALLTLKREREGLAWTKQRIEEEEGIPFTIKDRIRQIASVLRKSVDSIMQKLKEEKSSPGTHELAAL
jgi:hypothetical protein